MPSYGGNARIITSCYISFLFAFGQWELSGKICLLNIEILVFWG